jgi:hypothetical protein
MFPPEYKDLINKSLEVARRTKKISLWVGRQLLTSILNHIHWHLPFDLLLARPTSYCLTANFLQNVVCYPSSISSGLSLHLCRLYLLSLEQVTDSSFPVGIRLYLFLHAESSAVLYRWPEPFLPECCPTLAKNS